MEITTIIECLVAWGLLVLSQSVFINGVYQSATGETKKRVDGTDEDSEMILYPLKKFFERIKPQLIRYKGDASFKINGDIWFTFKNIVSWDEGSNTLIFLSDSMEEKALFRNSLKSKFQSTFKIENGEIIIYHLGEEFYYSKWLRKPIIQCIKCMSSFWGALTYWPVVLFLFGFHWLEIPVFFADVFSLTYLNWILYKKAQ